MLLSVDGCVIVYWGVVLVRVVLVLVAVLWLV